jgi:hypothetical protein
MGKLIFWLVIVFVVLFALRLVSAAKSRARRDVPRTPGATPMIKCADCGVFLPATDATPLPSGYRCGDPACPNRKRASV